MSTWYVTFAANHDEANADLGVHHDGWCEVVAIDEYTARAITWKTFGDRWSRIYSADEFKDPNRFFPRGCLLRLPRPEAQSA